MRYEIKIVPKSEPNANGEWRSLPDGVEVPPTFPVLQNAWGFFEWFVPEDYFLVAYRRKRWAREVYGCFNFQVGRTT